MWGREAPSPALVIIVVYYSRALYRTHVYSMYSMLTHSTSIEDQHPPLVLLLFPLILNVPSRYTNLFEHQIHFLFDSAYFTLSSSVLHSVVDLPRLETEYKTDR